MNDPGMNDALKSAPLQTALEVETSLVVPSKTSDGLNSNGVRTVAVAEDDAERQYCRASPYNVGWSMRAVDSRHPLATKAR